MTAPFLAKAREAEIGVLSAMRGNLLEAGAIATEARIEPHHFIGSNSSVYAQMLVLWREGGVFDFTTLCRNLRATGEMSAFASPDELRIVLYESIPLGALPGSISALLECHAARVLHGIGTRLAGEAYNPATKTEGLITEARAQLESLFVAPGARATKLSHFLTGALELLESFETGANSIEFGLGLDENAGPFCRGDLVVIAGETKKGKSALAGNIVEHVAAGGKKCAVFSLEMTGIQNAERMLASQARVDIRSMKLRRRMIGQRSLETQQDANEMDRLKRSVAAMASWNVHIIEQSHGLSQIVAEMLRLKPDLTVVDYTQLVAGDRDKGDNREREVASISRALKRAAVQTDSVVVLLSQLNDDGRLRESRAIGQDANCVLFVEGEGDKRIIRVGAARSAPTGTEIKMDWKASLTKFSAP